jgi:hypothetical protein
MPLRQFFNVSGDGDAAGGAGRGTRSCARVGAAQARISSGSANSNIMMWPSKLGLGTSRSRMIHPSVQPLRRDSTRHSIHCVPPTTTKWRDDHTLRGSTRSRNRGMRCDSRRKSYPSRRAGDISHGGPIWNRLPLTSRTAREECVRRARGRDRTKDASRCCARAAFPRSARSAPRRDRPRQRPGASPLRAPRW